MSKNSVNILLVVIILGFILFYLRENKAKVDIQSEYDRAISVRDSLLRQNVHYRDSLNTLINDLRGQQDSLVDLNKKIDKRNIKIRKSNEKAHAIADTASVNYIKRYWATELSEYRER